MRRARVLGGERQLLDRDGVDIDRCAVEVRQAPLLGKQPRQVFLGRPAAPDDHLAQPLAGAEPFLERLGDLLV